MGPRSVVLALLFAGGCTWVYDAQYDDRRRELEDQRSEFLPADDKVQFIRGAQSKLFWVDVVKPLDEPTLHSFTPSTGITVDYQWSKTQIIDDAFHYGERLIADCSFGSVYEAYDANDPERVVATTGGGSTQCAVDGDQIYFLQGRDVLAWTPGNGEPATKVNLDTAGVGAASIGGFAVSGNTLVLLEGGDLWRVDLASGQGDWLENSEPIGGTVFFDELGALYQSSSGIQYTEFAPGHATFDLGDAIADGGYHLSFKHPDLQDVETSGTVELTMQGRHVIYRAKSGIFAFGLDTRKVTDLLLDTAAEDFGARPIYRHPVVTTDGTLFVMDDANVSQGDHPIYRVDLADRLR